MLRVLYAAILVSAFAAGAAAQVSPYTPPPDLTAPPADAAKSASGLISRVLTPGSGARNPAETDVVTVHYTGWAASDGRMFDSSIARGAPSTFPLNKVMRGWRECVQLMTVGEKRRCWIPESLAYKDQAGKPSGTVVFDVELIDAQTSPTVAPPDVKEPPADAHKTATGLAYRVLRPGVGDRHPAAWSKVTVNYTGWTTDGKMFDSSVLRGKPATFELNGVIPGWTEGVPLMVEGERTRFWIPESLAYKGESGQPKGMLVFDIELVRIE
jgi:FKBP-type peptidyl-prolyl cis-trans isomerase